MKKGLLLPFILFLFAILTNKGIAQVRVTSKIFAEVIAAFTASENSQLTFGRFSPGPYGGKILISPEGNVFTQGSVISSGGLHNPASFSITGEENALFSITLPSGPATLIQEGSAQTMIVDGWESIPASGTPTSLLQGGIRVINVGATLNIGPLSENPVGLYSGSYTIVFEYN